MPSKLLLLLAFISFAIPVLCYFFDTATQFPWVALGLALTTLAAMPWPVTKPAQA